MPSLFQCQADETLMKKRISRRESANSKSLSYNPLEQRQLLATIAVTTTLDVIDANDGLTSLREAIIESNSNAQDDEIVLGTGTFELAISGISEANAQTGDLDIAPDGFHSLTIRGDGSGQTVVDGNEIDRVFEILEDSDVTFEDLHITGGSDAQQPTSIGRRGGGIFNGNADLVLNRVRMTNNDTGDFGVGGAIYVAGGTYQINDSQLNDNFSDSAGSAIFARQSSGTILRSDISQNKVGNTSLALSVSQSTVESRDGSLLIKNSTIDENFRGVNAINGTLEVRESRFLRQSDANGSLNSFFNRDYAIASDGTEVDVVDSRFTANEKGIEFKGVNSDLTITGSLFHGNFRSVIFTGNAASITDSVFQRQTGGVGVIDLATVANVNLDTRRLQVEGSTFQFNNAAGIRGRIQTAEIISSNFVSNAGQAGIFHLGDLMIRDSQINNQRETYGVIHAGEELEIINSVISGNGNTGLYSQQSGNILISHSEITHNRGRGFGGGIRYSPFFSNSNLLISNSLIAENYAQSLSFNGNAGDGGAIYIPFSIESGEIVIASSTIVKNRADNRGGFGAAHPESDVTTNFEFRNSIVWGNNAPTEPLLPEGDGQFSVTAFHSFFSDDAGGDGVIPFGGAANNNQDRFPKFVDWAGGDYRLAASSPAINSGDNSLLERDQRDVDDDGNTIEFAPDLEFKGRALGGVTDAGAFEFRA